MIKMRNVLIYKYALLFILPQLVYLFACLPAIKPLNNLAQKSILLRLSLENVTKMVTVS